MKKKTLIVFLTVAVIGAFFISKQENTDDKKSFTITTEGVLKTKNKLKNARQLYAIERELHEFNMQKNPLTGVIPKEEKRKEYQNSLLIKQQTNDERTTSSTYVSRGPSNLGGRTRAFAVDISDNTSNTMLAGGVSSGLFRTTDGGASWAKVSANDEIHNVTALAQDPRVGFQNIWYYATGEGLGNTASLGSFYFGQGVWKSTDSGLTWTQIPETNSTFTSFDSRLDLISSIKVSPINGDLIIGATNRIYRYDGTNLITEINQSGGNSSNLTDVVINSTGRVFASFHGGVNQNGVWTSQTGNGSWTRIAENGSPTNWAATGRIVLGKAPSNDNIIYALYVNGNSGGGTIEADLWQYNLSTNTWTDYSSKLPDEPGGDSAGNDPFAVQGGYDLVVSVKLDDENFVVIGGTNMYKIENIVNDATFTRIGGYLNNQGYALYNVGGTQHHPDIHSLEFDPNTVTTFYSGTDGGVHKTTNIEAASVNWESLNNNYITYQYYHVALDPLNGSNIVLGGAQDNGTTLGGTDAGLADNTAMNSIAGGDGVAVSIARRNANADVQLYLGVQNGTMFRTDPDVGFVQINPSGSGSQFVTYFYLDPDNNDILYYAGNSVLYRTDDAQNVTSSDWSNLGSLPGVLDNLKTFATTRGTYDPATSYLLIGGDNGGVFKVNDPKNVSSISNTVAKNITPTGAAIAGSIVSGLAIHPTNPDIVLAVYSNYGIENIFLTTNATATTPTWTMVERNLSAHSIRSAAITVVDSEVIYFVGTARGLYSSTDPINNDWEIEGANTIGLALVSGLVYRPSDNKLLIGTHGNGMYETTVEGTLSAEKFNENNLSVSLYPNPTQNELNFKSSVLDLSNSIDYKISDITGKTVKQGVIQNKKIDVESLNSGVYIINLNVDNKKQALKFMKN